ncbi:MAG: T9SS type A sorting domain-containing protein [Fluviicola sp.]|nr:T9SS type A sorting domain-containing protein [Fluviicola sp.]
MKTLTTLLILFLTLQINAQSNINVSNANFFEGEPFLAIDPANDQHLVAAWMGFKVGEAIVIKTNYSDDGGITWTTPTTIAHEIAGNTSADVVLKYDGNGNLFMSYVDYESTNFTFGKVILRKSIDNGVSWGNSVEAMDAIVDCPNKLCVDRPFMVIDQSNNIFITSGNANQPSVISPYNPYFVVSTDGGVNFTTPAVMDGPNFLAGDNVVKQPIPSPTIAADGSFYAAYPSYVFTQNFNAQLLLAKSTDLGVNFTYSSIYAGSDAESNPLAKRGFLLLADPTLTNHLVLFAILNYSGDADIYLTETIDVINWSAPSRVNQDLFGNGRMQDLVWADFNSNGDLGVCWRDRRNGATSGYQTETEIYATVKYKDSSNFENDFVISSQLVNHDAVLEGSGNDFMNVQFVGDTLYSVWGDVRTGTLNIFINKTNVIDGTVSTFSIAKEEGIIGLYPNPSQEEIHIQNFDEISDALLINSSGKVLRKVTIDKIDIRLLPKGTYLLTYNYKGKRISSKFVKN